MTMSQIPDVNRELAEVGALVAVFRAVRDAVVDHDRTE